MRLLVGLGLGFLAWGCAAAVSAPRLRGVAATPAPTVATFKRGLVFGTPDPYTLLGFDPEAQWLALCQAREDTDGDGITRVGFFHHGLSSGDAMKTYFVLGGGEGEVVDGYLGTAASGAWVALRKAERVYLLNTRTGAERELTQVKLDKEPDPSPAGGIRNLTFSPKKEELLLVQDAKAERATVALMDLATGELRQIDLGKGRVWRAEFSEDGSWIHAALVTADRNGNGSLDLPTIATTLTGDACGQPAAYSTFGLEKDHDEITSVAVPVAGGKVRVASEVQGTLEGDLVLTRADGSLVREGAAGSQQVLAGPACAKAVLDYYSLEHKRWLVACGVQMAPAAPADEQLDPRLGRDELWVFGQGLPKEGRATGLVLQYGPEPGHFGTERYSRLVTDKGTVLFDLKDLDVEALPEGYELCARHGQTYLLEPQNERRNEDDAPRMMALWSPGAALQPLMAARSCSRIEGDQQVLLDDWIFDWQAQKVVGTMQAACPDGDCRSLAYVPFAQQGFLLTQPLAATGSGAAGLQRRLRESLSFAGTMSYAKRGPLSFQSWAPPDAPRATQATPKGEFVPAMFAMMRDPAPSCELIAAEVKGTQSALPAWTEQRPLGGTIAEFPTPVGTSDDYPTYEYLQQQICAAPDLAFALEGVERALAVAEQDAKDPSHFDSKRAPADFLLSSLLRGCAPADTCRVALALADSRFDRVKREIAPGLLVNCDVQTVGSRFEQLHADPLLQLEWLILGAGRKANSAAKLSQLLEQTLQSKDEDAIASAVGLVLSDKRVDSAQVLLELRARLVKLSLPGVAPAPSADSEALLSVDTFDKLLGTSKDPRLLKLYRASCSQLATNDSVNFRDSYRCEAAEPGAKPTQIEPRFLARPPSAKEGDVTTLTRLLEPEDERACASALSGACPPLPAIKLRRDVVNVWQGLYLAASALTGVAGSPLAGGLLDTPLRKRHGKLEVTWRLWLDGQRYELGPDGIAQASLSWAQAQASPPDPDLLAIRGLFAWLNGVASERGSKQRFYFAKHKLEGYVLLATPEQACALTNSKALLLSEEPVWASLMN